MALQNWAGNYTYRARALHRPTSVAEVRSLVAGSDRVHGLGSRHCFNDVADTSGDLITLRDLPRTVDVDSRSQTVTLDGGITYGELAPVLQRHGRALVNLASLPHISVVGACATATHGSGDTNPNLAAAVEELDLVTGDGDLLTYRRGDDDFDGVVVSLGALGIVTRVVLRTVPTYDLATTVFVGLEFCTALEHLAEVLGAGYSVSLAPDWSRDGLANVFVKELSDAVSGRGDLLGAPAATTKLHPSPGVDPVACTEQLGVPGPWFERLPHFKLDFEPSTGEEIQSEFLIPREHAVAALDDVRGLAPRLAALAQSTEIRSVAADDAWLSPSCGVDVVGLHFTWVRDQGAVEALLPAVEQRLAPYGARPHWGKAFTADPDRLRSLFPRLDDFAGLVKRLDPDGTFGNDYLRRHRISG